MLKTVEYDKLTGDHVLIDVRSPGEFAEATIPGAVSVPLFSDAERERIGSVYVKESVEEAKRLGVQAAAARLPELYDAIAALGGRSRKLVFFCARGGMRSAAVTALFSAIGFNACKLKGGYKGYRAFINSALPAVAQECRFIVIHGKTGIGKTELLQCLEQRGLHVLDLEQAANHRGSLLGGVGLDRQHSQKRFESNIYEALKDCAGCAVFVEGESRRIGNVLIPAPIFEGMACGVKILAEASDDSRLKRLVADYGRPECREQLTAAIAKLERYIGRKEADRLKNLVDGDACAEAAETLMLKYYDPLYENEFSRHTYALRVAIDDLAQGCDAIEDWFRVSCDE